MLSPVSPTISFGRCIMSFVVAEFVLSSVTTPFRWHFINDRKMFRAIVADATMECERGRARASDHWSRTEHGDRATPLHPAPHAHSETGTCLYGSGPPILAYIFNRFITFFPLLFAYRRTDGDSAHSRKHKLWNTFSYINKSTPALFSRSLSRRIFTRTHNNELGEKWRWTTTTTKTLPNAFSA